MIAEGDSFVTQLISFQSQVAILKENLQSHICNCATSIIYSIRSMLITCKLFTQFISTLQNILYHVNIVAIMIEIDQSNKIERLEKDTILAFSNNIQRTIVIPARVKQKMFVRMRKRGMSRKNACIWMFSAGVFLLLKPYLAKIIKRDDLITIDTEYTGQNANIKGMILRHAMNSGFRLQKDRIHFAQIGKSSGAHKLAYHVQQGKTQSDSWIKLEEFLEL